MRETAKEKFWNVPNVLTLSRIALVPVFALTLLKGKAAGALAVIFLAGLTDVLDGLAARAWNQRTRIGTILDPIADKLLLSTAFILLTVRSLGFSQVIPLWLTAVVIGRDILILGGGATIYRLRGPRQFLPTVPGKISTVFQVTTVFWVILSNCVRATGLGRSPLLSSLTSSSVLDVLFVATLLFTVLSGTQYIIKGIRMAFSPGA